jgi:hypothetical protein
MSKRYVKKKKTEEPSINDRTGHLKKAVTALKKAKKLQSKEVYILEGLSPKTQLVVPKHKYESPELHGNYAGMEVISVP